MPLKRKPAALATRRASDAISAGSLNRSEHSPSRKAHQALLEIVHRFCDGSRWHVVLRVGTDKQTVAVFRSKREAIEQLDSLSQKFNARVIGRGAAYAAAARVRRLQARLGLADLKAAAQRRKTAS